MKCAQFCGHLFYTRSGAVMPRTFTREFKLEVCRNIESGQWTMSRVSREHALSLGMLGRWLEQYRTHGSDAFQGQPWRAQALGAAQQIEQLREELRQSQLEVKFLRQLVDQKKSRPGSES